MGLDNGISIKRTSFSSTLEELKQFQKIKQQLQDLPGRILVRYSGTENKLRFLVEAETEALCQERMDLLQTAAKLDFKIP